MIYGGNKNGKKYGKAKGDRPRPDKIYRDHTNGGRTFYRLLLRPGSQPRQFRTFIFTDTHGADRAACIFLFHRGRLQIYSFAKKYALRLLSFAVITQIPFCLLENGTLLTTDFFFYLNIFFTLFLGIISLMICESKLKKPVKAVLVVLLDSLTLIFQSQWLLFGIPIILAFYKFRNRPGKRLFCFAVCVCLMLLISYIQYEPVPGAVCFASDLFFLMLGYIIVTVFYNGNKGAHPRFSKCFFLYFLPIPSYADISCNAVGGQILIYLPESAIPETLRKH